MKQKLLVVLITALFLLFAGCQTQGQKRTAGAAIGGVLGGVLGNQVGKGDGRVAATIAGALIGAYIGGAIGDSMDQTDQVRAQNALETAPTNQPSSWQNPNSGNYYTVTPTNTYYSNNNPCRNFTTDAVIDGVHETVSGTACRQSDGSWRAVNT